MFDNKMNARQATEMGAGKIAETALDPNRDPEQHGQEVAKMAMKVGGVGTGLDLLKAAVPEVMSGSAPDLTSLILPKAPKV